MIGLALVCSECAGRPDLSHACRHGRRFLVSLADAVSVQAAYAFGDWPPAALDWGGALAGDWAALAAADPLWARYLDGDR